MNINEEIAIKRGWILNPSSISSEYSPSVKWYNPKTNEILYSHDPDYERNAKLYMALFEEMPTNTKLVKYEEYCSGKVMYKCEIPDTETDVSFFIGTSICTAYLIYIKQSEIAGYDE